jgi:hypothetical protein
MSGFVRSIAYAMTLVVWVVGVLPVWFGALGAMTILMALKIMTSLMSGRDITHGQDELDDLAALWPRGWNLLVAGIRTGNLDKSTSKDSGFRWSRVFAILYYSLLFWGSVALVWYYFIR